jgi:predicted NBD/HSP70 family sugar kinase
MKQNSGVNLENIQNMNRALVIKLLYGGRLNTRISIAEASGLNRATVSNIVDDLITWGLVRESGNITGKKGRRSIALELNYDRYVTICVQLLRDALAFGVLDLRGNYKNLKRRIPTTGKTARQIMELLRRNIDAFIESVKKEHLGEILGIGVAVPGPFIRESGTFELVSHAPGWENFDIAADLDWQREYPVFLEHDANCAAFAEWWYKDSASRHSSILVLLVGPGIGGGIIENGKLLRGCQGIAGEVGHVSINFEGPLCECGNRGCLELYASTSALEKEAAALYKKGVPTSLSPERLNAAAIFAGVAKGDPLAIRAFDRTASILGLGIVNLVNTYNPEVIYIGDILSQAPGRLLEIVNAVVKKHLRSVVYNKLQIKISRFEPEELIMMGAGAMVFDTTVSNSALVERFRRDR